MFEGYTINQQRHFWEWIVYTMLAGFGLLLCCSQALGQFTVSVEPSFTIEVEAVNRDDSPASSGRYLVKFTASWCGTCHVFDATQLPKLKAAGITPTVVDCTHGNEWGVTSLPEFWIIDRATQKTVEKITGYTSAESLIEKMNTKQADEPTKPIQGRLEVPAPAQKQERISMSHSEMVALHNRLHGGGSWTWPGDLAEHLRTTHGVSTSKPATTVRYQQPACPGGRCPVPTQRRRGIFGGWFR